MHSRFDRLEKEFFKEWIHRNPLLGTELGLHDESDERIPDGSLAKEQDDLRFLHRMRTAFDSVRPESLPPRRRVDCLLARHLVGLWIFEREELGLRGSVPDVPRLIGDSIFQILSRNYASLLERLGRILKRLQRMPRMIKESRSRVTSPVREHIEAEFETVSRLPGFFNRLREVARDHNTSKSLQLDLHRSIEAVQDALEEYCDWLIVDILPELPSAAPCVGEERLARLLKVRGLEVSPDRAARAAEGEIARLRGRLKEAARNIQRKAALEDVRNLVRAQHAETFDGVLRQTRESVDRARQFTARSKFATITPGDGLYVVDTPIYLRHLLPLTGYQGPARFEPKHEGFYSVTPGDCDSDKLKEHSTGVISTRTARAAWPGHHLRALRAAKDPTPLRALAAAPETLQGWAAYAEEQIREMGFDDTPPARFMSVQEQIRRAQAALLDAGLQSGRVRPSEAVDALIDENGVDRVTAEAEVRRFLMTPGEPLSALTGMQKIRELKAWARHRMKARFTETFFHDTFMDAGGIPLCLMKDELEWRIQEEMARPPAPPPVEVKAPEKGKKKSALPPGKKPAPHVLTAKESKGGPLPAVAEKKITPKQRRR